jgi:hypothetical protein
MYTLSPGSRALASYVNDPGVPLRFTPGFMLTPRFAGSNELFIASMSGSLVRRGITTS